ncbi:MAG TPA: hypothetical protein VKP67_13955 [Xanthobacteraceae bacterium]|nr:hypothetical protein [Xanthobacteraceae bacterium]
MSNITTVSPLHQRMIEDMAARKLNPHTQRSHISSCKRFAAWLKRVKLAQLAQAGGLSVEALSRRATTYACGQGLLLGVHQHRRGGRAPLLPPAASNDRKVVGQ